MIHHARLAVAAAICSLTLAVAPLLRAQATSTPAAEATLVVAGDVTQPLTIKPADLKTMPRTTVTVSEEGRQISYEGVLVGELLKRAGAPVGRDLSGKAVASYVRASAKDGYQVVFSLAELDPGFTPNDIIVADTVDGKPLFDYQGPFRIVAPHDKRGARSIRMLQRLEVVRLVK
jgi:DMSO/TMAO reductase YedYZ molybdopterin-dependent catalytic subunit